MKQTAVEWLFEQIINRTDRMYFLKEIEQAKEMEKLQMIEFHKWVLENDTPENAERYFHFSDTDVLNEYLKAQKL